MSLSLTRQALYKRVWSTPMTKLAEEFAVPANEIRDLCKLAGIPLPTSGYWMKLEYGKAAALALEPPPDGFIDPIELSKKPARTVQRDKTTAPKAVEPPKPAPAPPPPPVSRPTTPTTLTRQALYDAVWSHPISHLGPRYGVSDVGLAKICAKAEIPCPPRGYWARKAAGQATPKPKLPRADAGEARITIHPTPLPALPEKLPPEVSAAVEEARQLVRTAPVQERLLRPHPVIAKWFAEHEDQKRKARQFSDPAMRRALAPDDFGEVEKRCQRLLDALFKSLEASKAKVSENDRRQLVATVNGEEVLFQLRERQKKTKRPLTESEQRWRSPGDKDWKQQMQPTGLLVLEIKTWLPGSLPTQWAETETSPLDGMLADIVATMVAAGPLLVRQRQEREEAARQRQIAELRRYEEQQRLKRERNRLRRFKELAEDWRDLAVARQFLETLKACPPGSGQLIDGRTVEEWLAWAEERLNGDDPLAAGLDGVFRDVGSITEWSYRD